MTRHEKRARSMRIVKDHQPWYHPIVLPGFVFTRPVNRETIAQWIRAERGARKLNRFILPALPEGLNGKSVVEIGSNAGAGLIWALRHGASHCLGIEENERYYAQAIAVRDALGISWEKLDLVNASFFGEFPLEPEHHGFDYCWVLNTLYHIPDHSRASVLRAAGWLARYVVVQGNGLEDRGRGDGYDSLMLLVKRSGLKVHSEKRQAHVRGLVVVCHAG